MSLKKPHTITKVSVEEATAINQNFDRLYQTRAELLKHRDISSSGIIQDSFQSIETGQIGISATPIGSPTITKIITPAYTYTKVLYVNAHAPLAGLIANVTDITSTAITIVVSHVSATANLSNVFTASLTLSYQIIGKTS